MGGNRFASKEAPKGANREELQQLELAERTGLESEVGVNGISKLLKRLRCQTSITYKNTGICH
jgi:hypothetical protein